VSSCLFFLVRATDVVVKFVVECVCDVVVVPDETITNISKDV